MSRIAFFSLLSLLCWIGGLLCAQPCQAQLLYNVKMNTSQLIGQSAGPFSLDFQLTDGSGLGDANNTVRLNNFQFSGGSALGSPILTGGTSGTLAGTVTLTDNTFFSEFTQGFTPGSLLSFNVATTANVDAGPTPDEFSFAVLDNTGTELPTQGPGDGFLIQDITSSNPTAQTFASDPTRAPLGGGKALSIAAPIVTPLTSQIVPESSGLANMSGLLLALSLTGLLRLKARKKQL